MPNTLLDSVTTDLLEGDRQLLKKTLFPIVTLSASFRDKVESQYDKEDGRNHPDVVFSRAHYSMALAVAIAAWGTKKARPERAWLVDPTNYVQREDWKKAASMELVGRILARSPVLNWVKQNVIDRYARSRLPITPAIQGPLLYLMEEVERPIISLHIETGNMLAQVGKEVIQVVTDPHVREDYLYQAQLPNIRFCVFDEATKKEFLEKADSMQKKVDQSRVIVTGSPIDPRVVSARSAKEPHSWQRRELRILLTTGGLGTNKEELGRVLTSLLPLLRRRKHLPVQVVYYAGTNLDHKKMVQNIARAAEIPLGEANDPTARLRVLYADDLVDANSLLLSYGFPWADVVVAKPSGDMAYDAVAAGCALLLLKPWGEWEKVIAKNFIQQKVAQWAEGDEFALQIEQLAGFGEKRGARSVPWISAAIEKSLSLPRSQWSGAKRILEVASASEPIGSRAG